MELSLNALVDELDDLFFQRASRDWRVASGTQTGIPPISELPELARLDAWQAINEVLSSPRVDESKRARLELLRRHIAYAFVEARRVSATHERDTFLETHTFFAAAKTWTPAEAMRELPRLAARESRVSLSSELSQQLLAHQSHAQRHIDMGLEAVHALKLTPEQYVETLQGRAPTPRLETAATVLRETEAAHVDLLNYALKRVDPQLNARNASAHDARRTWLAPWLFELFRREDLQHALSRTLTDLNLSPNADGRLTVDTTAKELKSPHVFELRVPDQVRLLLAPGLGIETYATWLGQWALALQRANVGRTLPFVERRLGDRAVLHGVRLLFESLLLDEGWLKRYLRLTANQAREAARAFAFRQLSELRVLSAHAGFSLEAAQRGASSGLDDEYISRLSPALGVEAQRGVGLFEVDLHDERLLQLDGYALEFAWRKELRERFNEDFWRNPATGSWLLNLSARGQREDAVTLAKSLGHDTLPLAEAARERVQIVGA